MKIGTEREVLFGDYCSKCVFKDLSESEDPCWDCLQHPVREFSKTPVRFKENRKGEKKDGKDNASRGTGSKNKRAKRGR